MVEGGSCVSVGTSGSEGGGRGCGGTISCGWNIVIASILRAHTPRINAFFIVSSYVSLSRVKDLTSSRASSNAFSAVASFNS